MNLVESGGWTLNWAAEDMNWPPGVACDLLVTLEQLNSSSMCQMKNENE